MKYIIKPLSIAFAACSIISSSIAQEAPAPSGDEANKSMTYADFKGQFATAVEAGNTGKVSDDATVKVQPGQVFLDGNDTNKLMQLYGNLPASYDGGICALDESYIITFSFNDSGYVKDDEKEDLDADELMEVFKESDEAANEERQKRGLGVLNTVGWAVKPNYNSSTNNLEWALILKDGDGNRTVNHNIKLLGRRGVMDVTLICDPAHLESLRPMIDKTLAEFKYTSGNTYAEYKEGDKVSEYGLKALIAGGGILAAAKLGFLAKFWKLIVGAFIAIGAFFGKIKDKIFGSKSA